MSEPVQEIEVSIDTNCQKCIFAKRSKSGQQTGCEVGRLEKFADRQVPLEVIEHEGGSSYIIKNRICLMCCPPDKAAKLNNPAIDMRKMTALKCAVYVVLEADHSIKNLETTLDSLINQEHQPAIINLIAHQSSIPRPSIIKLFKQKEEGKFFTWNTTFVYEDGASTEWCLDHAIAKCGNPFYSVFIAGFPVPANYLSSIDKALNDELLRFSILMPVDDYWNGAFVQTVLHKSQHFQGNIPMKLEEYEDGALIATSIMDKVEHWAKQEGRLHMVKKVEEICPEIKQAWESLSPTTTTING